MDKLRRSLVTGIPGFGAIVASGLPIALSLPVPAAETKLLPLPSVGSVLALPEVALFGGRTFNPTEANGQVLVLYWWASWCPFCEQQSPLMEKLWKTQHKRGLQMLALSIDKKREDATAYLQKKGYTFPAGLVTPDIARILPKPRGLPVTVVRGRDGKVLQAEMGQLFPEDVEQLSRWL